MKRRDFAKTTGTALAGLEFGLSGCTNKGAKRKEQPNILFIMTDQQSARMMSCAGNQTLKTPAMDRLAASGIRFQRAYAANPVCVPSRFSLQTGLMPSTIGMGRNEDAGQASVTERMVQQSLGNLFKNAGYETVYGGKVHLPNKMNELEAMGYRPLTADSRQGLAESCSSFIKEKHHAPFLLLASFINPHDICYMAINDYRHSIGEPPLDNIDAQTCARVLGQALQTNDLNGFIKTACPPLPQNHGIPEREPSCITLRYTEARPFRAYIRKNWPENQWRLHRWVYARLTEIVDQQIGMLLDALRESSLEDDTLVVFTSDHGDMDAAHKLEHKSVLYEEAIHVPLILRLPRMISGYRTDNTHLVSNGLDLLPTLCSYAGIPVPEELPGISLKPLVEGDDRAGWRDFLVVESQNGRMLRTDRYKYCVYDSGENRIQLIDLQDDPGEMHNHAGEVSLRKTEYTHQQWLKEWLEKTGDRIGSEYV